MNWVENEVQNSTLPDARLERRLKRLLSQLGQSPDDSVPASCVGWSETLAAYRFFDNPRVSAKSILSGHTNATCKRISEQPVVLLVQDTTQLSYISEGDKAFERGTLHRTEQERYWLHPSVAFTPDRVNLGIVHHEFWQREATDSKHTRQMRRIEDKESMRWLRGYEIACAVQKRSPATCVVSVADREGDIYEWFVAAAQQPEAHRAEYVIRANNNRRLSEEEEETKYLWQKVSSTAAMGRYTLNLPRTPTRAARSASVEVRAATVTLRGPHRHGEGRLPSVEVNVVQVCEVHAPKGTHAIEWMLLCSLAAENLTQAQTLIGWYRSRWEVEQYFHVLKTGCTIESLRLENDDRLENAIAAYMIVAWRLHNITMLARESPELSCERVFSREEWRLIYTLRRKPIPEQTPPLRDCVRLLAQTGGFLARTGDGEPGVKTVWRGYIKLTNALDALEAINTTRRRRVCV